MPQYDNATLNDLITIKDLLTEEDYTIAEQNWPVAIEMLENIIQELKAEE